MPDVAELQTIETDFAQILQSYSQILGGIPVAPADRPDPAIEANILAEGVFLRCFTSWENSVEKAFLYFCEGGTSLNGVQPTCRLAHCTTTEVRSILMSNGMRYLDWSSPGSIRTRANLYFHQGIPFEVSIGGKSAILSDIQKLRNRIAHDSVETANGYREVQRNNFNTERNFDLQPGQLLRIVARKTNKSWGEFYFDELLSAFNSIVRP